MNWTPDLWICVPVQRKECPTSAQNSKARSFVGVNRIGKAFANFFSKSWFNNKYAQMRLVHWLLVFFNNYSVKF